MNVIECVELGKRYRRAWAPRDCTLGIPAGHVVALVGPNGAGKTTLLNMAVGLAVPTTGVVTVLGGTPAGSPDALDRIAFVAQDAPLYNNLPVADMLHVARNLNRRWDHPRAEKRLAGLGIPLKKKVGQLSGGQKAQLALTVALARRPDLLVLDEPLDPLARHDFMQSVMATVTEDGISVMLSSHVVAEQLGDVPAAGARLQPAILGRRRHGSRVRRRRPDRLQPDAGGAGTARNLPRDAGAGPRI
jgi:ABC-2 type transport system ATP-binding protein